VDQFRGGGNTRGSAHGSCWACEATDTRPEGVTVDPRVLEELVVGTWTGEIPEGAHTPKMRVTVVVDEPVVPVQYGRPEIPADCVPEGDRPYQKCFRTIMPAAADVRLEGMELGPESRFDIIVSGYTLECQQPRVPLGQWRPSGCALLTAEFSTPAQGKTLLLVFDEQKRLWAALHEEPAEELRLVGQRLE
jgi:hypothetical protein